MQMHDQFPRWTARVAMILLLAILTACAPRPDEPDRHPAVETAEDALSRGDFDTAVASFLEAAEAEESPLREEYTLMAAAALVDSGEPGRGERMAADVPITEETPDAVTDFRNVVLARAALADGDYERSLELVAERLPSETGRAADLVEVRADAQYRLGRLLDSAETRAGLEALLPDGDRLDRNRQRLQDTLSEVPMSRLREIMPPAPDIYGGWLELTFLVRNYRLDPPRMEESVELWRERFPDHPAAETIADNIMARYREEVLRPERVDLLLPLSGSLADSGRAVRDGFLAARLQQGDDGPDVRIHDIGDDGDDPWAAYMNAVQGGSDLVIGPLTRPAVSVFAETRSLPVPMLALNSAGGRDDVPGNLFRFGLLPEHEARQAARHALAGGQRHAVMLVPSNDWGRRVAAAFTEEYEDNGGTVLAHERYESDRTDFSLPIRRMLALDESGQRQRRLQSTIGRSVEFEPRRRMDVDVIFMGAFPRQARLIRPQLRFHHALDLPVMATSHAWDGRDDVASDRDMAGVVFFDMPWMLGEGDRLPPTRTSLATAWDDRVQQHAPLYALGTDAYRLIPYLATMRANDGERLEGATGLLRISDAGEVHREVMPARFHRGRVERLQLEDDTPRLPGLDTAGDDANGAGAPAEADGIDARNGLDETDFNE
ncbi:penicillin-binding protein activator [Aquisalimonas sp.]|uniref:penicillin-binding protein activator n=1 Tax=unclassified Aquisalimonas TaxID=2644645 RepID=UPI0025C278B1|nr:penicillin-binding protein activator [Aquisalimonas sp.]